MIQSASPEVVSRFHVGFECWNGGELDLMKDMYAEDGEFDVSLVFTDVPAISGYDQMRRFWDELWETWEGVRQDPLEVFDVGGGRFVVDVRLWGKGKRSGAEVDQRFGYLYTVRASDEKIVRCQMFPSVQAAIEAAEAALESQPTG